MTTKCKKSKLTRKLARLTIFRNFRNWLSKNLQPCDFCDFSQTPEKSKFLQLRANLGISEIAVCFVSRGQLWPSVYQLMDARTRKTSLTKKKLLLQEVGLRRLQSLDAIHAGYACIVQQSLPLYVQIQLSFFRFKSLFAFHQLFPQAPDINNIMYITNEFSNWTPCLFKWAQLTGLGLLIGIRSHLSPAW